MCPGPPMGEVILILAHKMPFRFNAKKLFATYPQAENLTHERVQRFYQELGCSFYTIGQETHADGGKHFHCFIEWTNVFDTRDERKFDIDGQHPNVQTARNASHVYNYCIKDGNFISNRQCAPSETKCRKFSELVDAENSDTFWELLKRDHPRDYIINHERLEYYANKRYQIEKPIYSPTYTEFNIPDEVLQWKNEEMHKV